MLPKQLAVLRLNFSASFSFGELAQRRSNKRRSTSRSRGGVGQFIQELQGCFVNSHSNSFHIRNYINSLGQFQCFQPFPHVRADKVIKRFSIADFGLGETRMEKTFWTRYLILDWGEKHD
ncbi:MAG: hypothetical protein A2W66_10720 [Deltaproteobacteria bacterium RIFCSPLOWO2_02_56_12]|nr:MAG: hypothetical protein A2W66_10720 [Deltaproteobacteria bacterium RIFCSPLOWO2_02_56_12]